VIANTGNGHLELPTPWLSAPMEATSEIRFTDILTRAQFIIVSRHIQHLRAARRQSISAGKLCLMV